MKAATIKLFLTIAWMASSALLLRWTHWDVWFFTFLLGFLLSVLYGLDLGQQLRNAQHGNWLQRAAGLLLGIPQALLGLVCVGAGVAIVLWVLYNSFATRLPEYTGGFLTLGIGPALIGVGYLWLRSAFVRKKEPDSPSNPEPKG